MPRWTIELCGCRTTAPPNPFKWQFGFYCLWALIGTINVLAFIKNIKPDTNHVDNPRATPWILGDASPPHNIVRGVRSTLH